MKYDREFWDKTWSRPYGRYNSHHQTVWEFILPMLKGKVCDLGCGPCVIYKDKNIDLTGVDISFTALEEAKKNYPQGEYLLADATKTNLPSENFDTIIMLGLLDYFDDWDIILGEATRICKRGGKIIATFLHGFGGHDWKEYQHLTSNWHFKIWEV